jgi:hypothetical protein
VAWKHYLSVDIRWDGSRNLFNRLQLNKRDTTCRFVSDQEDDSRDIAA